MSQPLEQESQELLNKQLESIRLFQSSNRKYVAKKDSVLQEYQRRQQEIDGEYRQERERIGQNERSITNLQRTVESRVTNLKVPSTVHPQLNSSPPRPALSPQAQANPEQELARLQGQLQTAHNEINSTVINLQLWRASQRSLRFSLLAVALVILSFGLWVFFLRPSAYTHISQAGNLAWSPDGKTLAVGTKDGTVLLQNPDGTVKNKTSESHTARVVSLAWSPDGKILLTSAENGEVRLWNDKGQILEKLSFYNQNFRAIWSVDGKMLLAMGSFGVQILEKQQAWYTKNSFNPNGLVTAVAWTPDGSKIAVGQADGRVYIRDGNGAAKSEIKSPGSNILTLNWHPDNNTLAIGAGDGMVYLWKTETSTLTTLKGHTQGVIAVGWSPDGTRLATASLDESFRLWGSDGKLIKSYAGGVGKISGLTWSSDGQNLAVASEEGLVKTWNLNLGQ